MTNPTQHDPSAVEALADEVLLVARRTPLGEWRQHIARFILTREAALVAALREALECAQYELRLWVQTYGERGPTRFVMGSIDEALTSTAAVATPVPETEGGGR